MLNFILIHGSWHGGWCWDKIKSDLDVLGHNVLAPTLPGMDYNDQPMPRDVGLTEHIEFICDLIVEKGLSDVILVGHSYGGLVITGVAVRMPGKISKLIYLDAFLPSPGESLFDLSNPDRVQMMNASLVDENGKTREQGGIDPYLLPIRDPKFFGVEDEALAKSIINRLVRTSVKTFTDKVDVGTVSDKIDKYYIRCTKFPINERSENKAKELGYRCYRLDEGHDVMLTAPDVLMDLLKKLVH